MDIYPVASVEFNRIESQIPENRNFAGQPIFDAGDDVPPINFQEEMSNAAEEMANLLSAFGRFSRAGRKNDSAENDFVSSMLEDLADEKLDSLIKHVAKLRDLNNLLN
ncbi:MAG: invasion protein, partial [Kluyvera intermedia]